MEALEGNNWSKRKNDLLHDKLKKDLILLIPSILEDLVNNNFIEDDTKNKIRKVVSLWDGCRNEIGWLLNNYYEHMTLQSYILVNPLNQMPPLQKEFIKRVLILLDDSINHKKILETLKTNYEIIENKFLKSEELIKSENFQYSKIILETVLKEIEFYLQELIKTFETITGEISIC